MANEKMTDLIVAEKLKDAGITAYPNGSTIGEIKKALKSASKKGNGRAGYPEFVAQVDDFLLVIEDKADFAHQAKYIDESKTTLLMDTTSVVNFAENGAVHYAQHIIQYSSFKKVIAIGCSGEDDKNLYIRPIFVSAVGCKLLPRLLDFSPFATKAKIRKYYNDIILGKKPVEQVELEGILKRASALHEALRDYGNLGDNEKPLVVSALLLALSEDGFDTETLTGDEVRTDGAKIYEALSAHMDRVHVGPPDKKMRVLDQFLLIKNRPHLSEVSDKLGKSPLRYFAEYLQSNILSAIQNNTPEDVLGRFYGEFMSYSGGNGQTLGVVLTPKHITELFVDLAQPKVNDKVFDPCCGTAGFLIAAMNRMLLLAENQYDKNRIKGDRLHGVELRDDMFSIATTNMILRGDGKSNLVCGDFFKQKISDIRSQGYTVGFMNPPYSQGKKKVTAELTELKFIRHLLDGLADGARCVVIVPQSVMVGKTKADKADKRYIYDHHTLEGVITLNPNTFYGVGTNPVVAVFTAHQPHPTDKLVKFVNFKDDGYKVFPHLGLMPTSKVKPLKQQLLDCWHQGKSAPNSFIVRCSIGPDDEWLHSFFYFNEEIPSEADFEKAMADYLTFEFDMFAHGRGELFKESLIMDLKDRKWAPVEIEKILNITATKSSIDRVKLESGEGSFPYITRTDVNNGWDGFVGVQSAYSRDGGNVITIGLDTQTVFYQPTTFYTGQNIQVLSSPQLTRYVALFLLPLLKTQMRKFNWGGNGATLTRLRKLKLIVPVNQCGKPDFDFMDAYMRSVEMKLLTNYASENLRQYANTQISRFDSSRFDSVRWGDFAITDIFRIESGKRLESYKMESGNRPFVGASEANNGITGYLSNDNASKDKNVLGVNYNGSVCEAFYHPYEALFSDDVKRFHLRQIPDDKYVFLFLKTAILQQKGKFAYGYKFNAKRMERQRIVLPKAADGKPDYAFMRLFMQNVESRIRRRYAEAHRVKV